MRLVVLSSLGAALVVGLFSCGGGESASPDGLGDEDGAAAAPGPDSATDGGPSGTRAPRDAAGGDSAAPAEDAEGPGPDAGESEDAGLDLDATNPEDGGGDDDATFTPDAGASADAGGALDADLDATLDASPATFTVGGTVSGLFGTAVLHDNGDDELQLTANGPFTFPMPIAVGGSYAVTIAVQPPLPANDTCVLSAGSGVVGTSNVTSVVVTCTVNPPDDFAPGSVDVVTAIDTSSARKPISPLLYGVNGMAGDSFPAQLLAGVTLIRRGGDRGNTYNWETNVSNGGIENGYSSDLLLAAGVTPSNAPGGQDLTALTNNRAAGRSTMVPFVLNDFVAGKVDDNIPWDMAGWNRAAYFNKVVIVKPTPFTTTPDLTDGTVYTDEQLGFMRAQFPDDIMAPGPGRLLVGVDNEPDLWDYNFPMLQAGQGAAIYENKVQVGNQVTADEFIQRVISFTTRVKTMAPNAYIVGPSHFGFDGFRAWNLPSSPMYPPLGHWFMDDFLAAMQSASAAAGMRLLDTWDFHWYPQATFGGVTVSALDNDSSPLTAQEIQAIVQGPRSYWDQTYNEGSWITDAYHLDGPAYILSRLQTRIAAGYPGTLLGVSEYFPGGLNHIASGLATVDTLGVFQRMGVELAAMWPNGSNSACRFAFGGIELVRNADGNGMAYATTDVAVQHPEIVPSSVYAGMDTPDRVTVLVVNKSTAARTFGLRLTNAERLANVAVYTLDAGHASPYLAAQTAVASNNAYAFTAGALSASMLVFTTP